MSIPIHLRVLAAPRAVLCPCQMPEEAGKLADLLLPMLDTLAVGEWATVAPLMSALGLVLAQPEDLRMRVRSLRGVEWSLLGAY
jgi:hypothetical protein